MGQNNNLSNLFLIFIGLFVYCTSENVKKEGDSTEGRLTFSIEVVDSLLIEERICFDKKERIISYTDTIDYRGEINQIIFSPCWGVITPHKYTNRLLFSGCRWIETWFTALFAPGQKTMERRGGTPGGAEGDDGMFFELTRVFVQEKNKDKSWFEFWKPDTVTVPKVE